MVTEDYISFETAKLLEKNGMAALNHCYYDKEGVIHGVNELDAPEAVVAAHTHQMALKWLREVHKIHIYTFYSDGWVYSIEDITKGTEFTMYGNKSSEDSVEAALKYVLENLI